MERAVVLKTDTNLKLGLAGQGGCQKPVQPQREAGPRGAGPPTHTVRSVLQKDKYRLKHLPSGQT